MAPVDERSVSEADRSTLDPYHYPKSGTSRKPGGFPQPIASIPVEGSNDEDSAESVTEEELSDGGQGQAPGPEGEPDLSGNIQEVLERFEGASQEELLAAIVAEEAGQGRSTLIKALTERLEK